MSTPQDIEAEIRAQRERLADTVDQLEVKLDHTKARARTGLVVAVGSAVVVAVAVALWRRRS